MLLRSDSQTAHEEDLDILLRNLKKAGLKASHEKAQIAFSLNARKLIVGRKESIQRLPIPTTIRGVKKTQGLFGYVHRFIPSFSLMATPLNALMVGDMTR